MWRAPFAIVASLILSATLASAARAATVTFTLQVDSGGPGTWSLFLNDSIGDNAGVDLWAVSLSNVNFPVTVDSPYLTYLDVGSMVRTLGLHSLEVNSTNPIGSAQDIIGGSPIVYGFGQTGGTLTTPGGGTFITQRNPAYLPTLALAHGTYSGVAPSFTPLPDDDAALVFVDNSGFATIPATMEFVTNTPEPILAAPVLLATALLRRRR